MGEGWPSRRKYISMNVTFFAAIGAFIIAFAIVMLYRPGQPTAADLSRLAPGMTPAEVTAILGEPKMTLESKITAEKTEATWTYDLPASKWSVVTQSYQLKFYEGKLDSWWKVK